MSLTPFNFDIQKRCFLETFQGEISSETLDVFKENVDRLVQNHKDNPQLIELLKQTLESLNSSDLPRTLQGRVQSESKETTSDTAVVRQLALEILRPQAMKTMLQSRIEALTSENPQKKLEELQSEEILVLRDLKEGILPQDVLDALALISETKESREICKSVIMLFQGITDDYHRANILRAIQEIPEAQRAHVIRSAAPVLQGITNGHQRAAILRAVQAIPEAQRAHVIQSAEPILQGITHGLQRANILRAIQEIPEAQRAHVIRSAAPVLQGITNGHQRANILRAVQEIPEAQRAHVIQSAAPILQGITDGEARANILRAIQAIPEDQRVDVIRSAAPILQGITHGWHRTTILRAVQAIPADQRTDVIQSAEPILQGITDGEERADILRAINEIPKDQRAHVIQSAAPILQGITNGSQRASGVSLLASLPPLQENDVLERILRFFLTLPYSGRLSVLAALKFLSPQNRWEALDFLEKTPTALTGSVILAMFKARPPFVNASHDYLAAQLETLVLNPAKARDLAQTILNKRDDLLIHDEQLLFQKSLEVLSITDPALMNNPKNPYRLYATLKQLVETEPLWEGSVPVSLMKAKRMAVNLAPLRATQKSYVVEDLPQESHQEGFKQLFNRLQERTRAFPEIEREIQASYGKSLSELAENLVNGAFIQRCLQIPTKPNEPIDNTTFYLYSILRFLSGLNTEPEKVDLVSSGESALLAFSEAVRNCSTGQLDGIAGYYNALPVEFRTESKAETTTQKKLASFMNAFVQSTLTEILTGNAILTTLTGQSTVSQESHQTLYLKNRLCKQLGLDHRVQFDAHTGSLDDRMINASLDDLMQAVLQYYTPGKLVSKLSEEIDRSLKDTNSGLMVPLDEFFEALGGKDGRLSCDEESGIVTISEEGALLLLEGFGYVEDGSKA